MAGISLSEEVGPKEPIRSKPLFRPLAADTSWRIDSARPRISRARTSSRWPSSVTSAVAPCRSMSWAPSSCSSDLMAWEIADWLTPSRMAAAVKPRNSATRAKISSWVNVMRIYSFFYESGLVLMYNLLH